MENRICLDTTTLVNVLRNKKEAVAWIKEHEQGCLLATTTINLFELFYGAYKSAAQKNNVQAVEQLMQRLIMLNVTKESAKHAGEQLAQLEKHGEPIEFRDILIGTIAATENFVLKTENRKHFDRIKDLIVI